MKIRNDHIVVARLVGNIEPCPEQCLSHLHLNSDLDIDGSPIRPKLKAVRWQYSAQRTFFVPKLVLQDQTHLMMHS